MTAVEKRKYFLETIDKPKGANHQQLIAEYLEQFWIFLANMDVRRGRIAPYKDGDLRHLNLR